MVQYLYNGDYETEEEENSEDAAILHVRVFQAADMYQITRLAEVALGHFKVSFRGSLESKKIARVVDVVYTSTAAQIKEFQEHVVDQITPSLEEFQNNKTDLLAALEASPKFAQDLIFALHKKQVKEMDKVCANLRDCMIMCRKCYKTPYDRRFWDPSADRMPLCSKCIGV
ncbi:hypothetical protein IWZ01DRAFT_485956 [Phyllosticta capitalensis]